MLGVEGGEGGSAISARRRRRQAAESRRRRRKKGILGFDEGSKAEKDSRKRF